MQAGQIVYLIAGEQLGFIDRCRYKTQGALASYRRYVWKTEDGARTAFANIHRTFPRFGPRYTLHEAVIEETASGLQIAQPVRVLDRRNTEEE